MKLPVKIIFKLILASFLFVSSFSFVFAANTNTTYSPKAPLVISRSNQGTAYSVSIKSNPTNTNKKVQGAFDLVFVVTPDANGNWSYSVPDGLDPGTYTVTVKDQNGNVLETSTFTVSSTQVTGTPAPTSKPTNLPNTGILDEIVLPVFGALTIAILGGYFSIRYAFKKNVIE